MSCINGDLSIKLKLMLKTPVWQHSNAEPRILVKQMKQNLEKALENYDNPKEQITGF